MKVRATVSTTTLMLKRKELADVIYSCILLLEKRHMHLQTIGDLRIVCVDQDVYSEIDPADNECKTFIDVLLSVRARGGNA